MKKIFVFVLIFTSLFILFAIPSFAADKGEEYWQDFTELVPEGTVDKDMDNAAESVGIKALLLEIINAISGESGAVFSFLAMLFGLSLLIALAECRGLGEKNELSRYTSAGVSTVCAFFIFKAIYGICLTVSGSIAEISAVFSGLIPIASGILAAGGAVNSAAMQAFNMNLALGTVSYVSSSLLIPLVLALISLALVSSVDGGAVTAVAKWIKGAFAWIIGIGTAVIIGAVSMQSIITGAQDSAYLRAAKYAATGMIPVVGSTVSAALTTLAGGLSYVKSTVGVLSVMLIVVLATAPLISLLLYRMCFSITISFLELVGAGGGAKTFTAFRSAFDALISVYALSALIYIAEIIVFLRSGVTVFG